MGHADFINLREAHGKTDIYLFFVFHHTVDFITDVACRFFNLQ